MRAHDEPCDGGGEAGRVASGIGERTDAVRRDLCERREIGHDERSRHRHRLVRLQRGHEACGALVLARNDEGIDRRVHRGDLLVGDLTGEDDAIGRPGGPRDAFELQALEQLRKDPYTPVVEFTEYEGRPVLRYATAEVLDDTCLKCHNVRLDSPRRTWKEGEVRGVLEIIRPLDRDQERAREGLRGTFGLMAAVFAALLALTVLVLVAGNRRRGYAPPRDGEV